MATEPAPVATDVVLEQACAWLVKRHSGDFTAAQQRRLNAWRKQHASHEQAWQHALVLWQGLDALPGCAIPGAQPLSLERRRLPAHRRYSALAAAACFLLAVSLAIGYPPVWRPADYRTDKGEQRTVALQDGSQLTLNTDSAVAIHFADGVRRIDLLQGEAYFAVAKALQPFVVGTDQGEIRAVGTAFAVQQRERDTQVELLEGVVEIRDAQHRQENRLVAGQKAVIDAERIAVADASVPTNLALWRQGYLQFDGTPLAEAIAEINRYRPGRVLLLNRELAAHRISGVFRLDALEQAIASLKAAVPQLKIISITGYWVILG